MEAEEADSPLISIGGSVSPESQVEGFFDNSFYTKNPTSSSSSSSSSSSGESSDEEQEQIEVKQEQFEQVEPQQQVDNELLNIKLPLEDQIVEMFESDLVEQNDLVLNDDDIIMQDEPVFADDDEYDEGFDFDEPDNYYYNEEQEVEEQVVEQHTAIDGPDEYYEEEEEQVVEQDTTIDEPDEYYYEEGEEEEEEEQVAEPDEPDEPPAGESYYNLETFTLNVTKEDRAKRNETLKKHKLFFTEEEYNRYALYKPDIHDENQKLLDKLSATLAALRKRRILNKKRDLAVEEEETPVIIKKPKIEPQVEQKPIQQKRTLLLQKPFSPYEQKPTILDTVLTNMLRYNKQQASTTTTAAPEPSDLEIAAMAAGILPDPSNTTPQERRSRYNKDQHIQFLRISNELKSGSTTIPQSDIELYKSMCPGLKIEQDEFVKEQRKKVLNSGVYDTLDKKVEKMVEEFYAIEHTRLLKYPQFYKYFNLLNVPPQNIAVADQPILSFKKSLLQTGQIAACKPSMLESPRRLDLFKKYLYKPSKIKGEEIDIEDDEDDDGDKYYKKKLPPTVSTDKNITNLLQTNKADIVISSDTMVSFVELIHDISSDLCIPITVVEKDNVRTLIFDRQLPKEAMTARERNKMIYDLTFKSLCLDWTKRHNITNAPAIETISSGEETGNAKVYDDWDSEKDENLQYNLWSFGDMNILIRHQADGEIIDNASKKPGSKERRVCLTSKLDYQISNGLEEIIMPTDRAANWLRSYIGGHALVLEGRIDVINNRLIRIDRKEMVDIMGAQWKPMQESELLRHTFSKLLKILLLPGKYLLVHEKDDRNFLIYQTTTENEKSYDIDLHKKFSALKKPILVNKPDKTYIPAWSSIENQVPWTFPPK